MISSTIYVPAISVHLGSTLMEETFADRLDREIFVFSRELTFADRQL